MSGSNTSPDADLLEEVADGPGDSLPAAEAFSLLGNETRITILQELWLAPEQPVAFSDLRKRVGMRDSAQFNYHLSQLTDHFVRKTDGGYEFQYAGEKVVRAILAGTFTDRVTLEFPVTGECFSCGGGLEARYADERLAVGCEDCDATYGRYAFPPGGLRDRTDAEVAAAFDQRVRHLHCLAADGVCPECGGRMDTDVVPDDDDRLGLDVRVDHTCAQCQHTITSPVGLSLLDDSTVVAFHAEHGVDLNTREHWTLRWCVTDETTTYKTDPERVTVTIPLDGEELAVTLDGDLRVLNAERRCGDAEGGALTTAD
ncbi:MAG: winged helix-turn-helix domain-containing protein [Halobacterium sp.]